MILEHRTYTFKPGTVDKWVKKYQADGLPVQQTHTMKGAPVEHVGMA